jgi:hypothetical protein
MVIQDILYEKTPENKLFGLLGAFSRVEIFL